VPLLIHFDSLAVPSEARYPADDLAFSVGPDRQLRCAGVNVATVHYASATFEDVSSDSAWLDVLVMVYGEVVATLNSPSRDCCAPGYRRRCDEEADLEV